MRQSCPHTGTSQLICTANQLTGLYIETSQLICPENQLTSFYMRATLALNELIVNFEHISHIILLFPLLNLVSKCQIVLDN